MNRDIILVIFVMVLGVLLVGCTSSQTGPAGYSNYNSPEQQQYVGGGCGVAPSGDYTDTPINELTKSSSVL